MYFLSQFADVVEVTEDAEQRKAADDMLSLLTPIAKAFLTETGSESAA